MRPVSLLFACGIFVAGQAHSQSQDDRADVVKWFDGCAALTQDWANSASEMDRICAKTAYSLCEVGRLAGERPVCIQAFTQHLRELSVDLQTTLPSGEELTGIRKEGFERAVKRVSNIEYTAECSATITEDMCQALGAVSDWTTFRQLHRIMKNFEKGRKK